MPVVLPAMVGSCTTGILGTGNIGQGVPKLSTGIATGLSTWVPKIVIQTSDTGSLGAGKSAPTPITVATPLLYANLLTGAGTYGIMGVMQPLLQAGLANGLTVAFAAMLINTVHAGIGTGAGVARFQAPPCIPEMIAGFQTAQMNGEGAIKQASAIGLGLDLTFKTLVLPVVITGSASPAGGTGVGVGNIV